MENTFPSSFFFLNNKSHLLSALQFFFIFYLFVCLGCDALCGTFMVSWRTDSLVVSLMLESVQAP